MRFPTPFTGAQARRITGGRSAPIPRSQELKEAGDIVDHRPRILVAELDARPLLPEASGLGQYVVRRCW